MTVIETRVRIGKPAYSVMAAFLVDGHNRYEICTRNGIEFETVEMEFESRLHARVWMRKNQRSRRNLSDAWRIELELADKADLAEIGKAKYQATVGRPPKELLSINDNDLFGSSEAIAKDHQ